MHVKGIYLLSIKMRSLFQYMAFLETKVISFKESYICLLKHILLTLLNELTNIYHHHVSFTLLRAVGTAIIQNDKL